VVLLLKTSPTFIFLLKFFKKIKNLRVPLTGLTKMEEILAPLKEQKELNASIQTQIQELDKQQQLILSHHRNQYINPFKPLPINGIIPDCEDPQLKSIQKQMVILYEELVQCNEKIKEFKPEFPHFNTTLSTDDTVVAQIRLIIKLNDIINEIFFLTNDYQPDTNDPPSIKEFYRKRIIWAIEFLEQKKFYQSNEYVENLNKKIEKLKNKL